MLKIIYKLCIYIMHNIYKVYMYLALHILSNHNDTLYNYIQIYHLYKTLLDIYFVK